MNLEYFVFPGAVIDVTKNSIGYNVVFEAGCKVGNGCNIQANNYLWNGVELEDKVFVGPSVVFTNIKHPEAFNQNLKIEKTLIKEGASIGANSTILCGVTVGKYSVIGAGSVVTKDVPDYTMVYGNPAKVIKKIKK